MINQSNTQPETPTQKKPYSAPQVVVLEIGRTEGQGGAGDDGSGGGTSGPA